MIATVQFDLSNPEELSRFMDLVGETKGVAAPTPVDKPMNGKPVKSKPEKPKEEPKEVPKEEPKEEPKQEVAPEAEPPVKTGVEGVVPTIEEISKLFTEAQARDVKTAGKTMKEYLAGQGAKSVRDLDDVGLFGLKKALESLQVDSFFG